MAYNNVFTSSFDAETTGGAPSGFTGTWTVQTPGLNSSAKAIGATSAENTLSRTFSEWNKVKTTFRIKTGSSGSIRQLRFSMGKATDNLGGFPGTAAALIIFEATGNVQLFTNDPLTHNLQAWAASTEYLVVMEVDCLSKRYTVTIGGTLYDNGGLGWGFYNSNTHTTIGQVHFDQTRTDTFLDDIQVDDYVPSGDTEIYSPASYRVIQRASDNTADIEIVGRYSGSPTAIEAKFNGGSWATIDPSPAEGWFSGTLTNQAAAQGTLQTRHVGGSDTASQTYVGIGDIFICAGQSNMSGRGTNNQSYSHATLKACLYGNDNVWKELTDPYDSAVGQIDTVSSDVSPAAAAGSYIPKIATDYMASQGIPCAFVPCAKGSTSITQWAAGGDHFDRTTLYGSMIYRATRTGARLVIWHQGEADALNGMSQATYNAALDDLANNIQADLGVKLMVGLLQNSSGIDDADEDAINDALLEAVGDNSNVLLGADMRAYSSESGDLYHLKLDATLTAVGALWFTAILGIFDTTPPTIGGKVLNDVNSLIVLEASETIISAGDASDYSATVNGASKDVEYVYLIDSTHIGVYISGPVYIGDTVTISYSGTSVTDSAGNPLDDFGPVSVTNNSTNSNSGGSGGGGGSFAFT